MATTMKAAVFVEPGRIVLEEQPIPDVGPLDALMRVTTTTICGTDVHILKGEYPVRKGLIIGHEPVGVIEKLGSAVQGYQEGQRVIAGAITPSGSQQCLLVRMSCSRTAPARRTAGSRWAAGGSATRSMAVRPSTCSCPMRWRTSRLCRMDSTDEQVLMCPDIMSTGFGGAESGGIRIGDTVAVFAQGPIGLCATAGREAHGRHDDHRRRQRAGAHRRWHAAWARIMSSTSARRIRSRRSCGSPTGAASMWRSKRSARRRRSKPACACCGPAERFRASACIRAI